MAGTPAPRSEPWDVSSISSYIPSKWILSTTTIHPIGEGPLGEAPRHSFSTYGERIEDEEQGFEQGCRFNASGFFYTQQHYNEQMVFQNYVHTSLAHNEQN
jgi:hypothetical protein